MAKQKITVETTVAATIDKAWKYWTSPAHITKWNFASDDWHCPYAENDVRTGGKFKSTMASKDGKMSFDFEGIYDEVIDKKKIAYSLGDKRHVTVDFVDLNGKTKITETFDPEEVNSVELQKSGWQSILDNFKKHIESGS